MAKTFAMCITQSTADLWGGRRGLGFQCQSITVYRPLRPLKEGTVSVCDGMARSELVVSQEDVLGKPPTTGVKGT
jgi:hypothetical protein